MRFAAEHRCGGRNAHHRNGLYLVGKIGTIRRGIQCDPRRRGIRRRRRLELCGRGTARRPHIHPIQIQHTLSPESISLLQHALLDRPCLIARRARQRAILNVLRLPQNVPALRCVVSRAHAPRLGQQAADAICARTTDSDQNQLPRGSVAELVHPRPDRSVQYATFARIRKRAPSRPAILHDRSIPRS